MRLPMRSLFGLGLLAVVLTACGGGDELAASNSLAAVQAVATRTSPPATVTRKPAATATKKAATSTPVPATATATPPYRSALPDRGPAPEISSTTWLNTGGKPVTLASLRGKVVIVDFWTLGCINCQHSLPGLVKLYNDHKADGLVVLGPHSPEFSYERDLDNIKAAITKWGITYPVPLDNDFKNWRAYNNSYWPAQYLIDKQGHIRALHIGEGVDANVRRDVEDLLKER